MYENNIIYFIVLPIIIILIIALIVFSFLSLKYSKTWIRITISCLIGALILSFLSWVILYNFKNVQGRFKVSIDPKDPNKFNVTVYDSPEKKSDKIGNLYQDLIKESTNSSNFIKSDYYYYLQDIIKSANDELEKIRNDKLEEIRKQELEKTIESAKSSLKDFNLEYDVLIKSFIEDKEVIKKEEQGLLSKIDEDVDEKIQELKLQLQELKLQSQELESMTLDLKEKYIKRIYLKRKIINILSLNKMKEIIKKETLKINKEGLKELFDEFYKEINNPEYIEKPKYLNIISKIMRFYMTKINSSKNSNLYFKISGLKFNISSEEEGVKKIKRIDQFISLYKKY